MKNVAGAAVAAAIIAGSLGTASMAGAASTHNTKNQTTYAISCANGFSGNAVVRRHIDPTKASLRGKWFVAHVVGGTKDEKVLVPTAIDVTFTFTNAAGTVTTNTEDVTKAAKAKKQTSCTLSGTNTVDGGSLAASGTVTGAFH
jgi:hypothetical protein